MKIQIATLLMLLASNPLQTALAFQQPDPESEPYEEPVAEPPPAPTPAPPAPTPAPSVLPDKFSCRDWTPQPEEQIASDYVENIRHNFCSSPAGALKFGEGTTLGEGLSGEVTVRAPLPDQIGWRANSTGYAIGGYNEDALGPHGDWLPRPAVDPRTGAGVIKNWQELADALDAANQVVGDAIAANQPIPRQTVYVGDGVDIEIDDHTLLIPPGLTLASGRGRGFNQERSEGGVIRSSVDTAGQSFAMVIVSKEYLLARFNANYALPLPPVRITGLRFIGPNPHEDPPTWHCNAVGRIGIVGREVGEIQHPSEIVDRVIEIDNNEFSSWPETAIRLEGIHGGYVHHNYIHHSQRHAQGIDLLGALCALTYIEKIPGYELTPDFLKPLLYPLPTLIDLAIDGQGLHGKGYGVSVNNGLYYIEANRFEMNRHSIASRGDKYTQYIAMYNIQGEDGPSHHFDVHGGQDRGKGYDAGGSIVFAYNTHYANDEDAINVRGNPVAGAWVTGNQFRGNRSNVRQTKVPGSCTYTPGNGSLPGTQTCTYSPERMYVDDTNVFGFSEPAVGGGGPAGGSSGGRGHEKPPIQQQ